MKWYKVMGAVLVMCAAAAPSPITGFAQSTEGKVRLQEQQAQSTERSNMGAYEKKLRKELRAMNEKIAALNKKAKAQASKLEEEARESWTDLKAKQKMAKGKLKALSKAGKETWEKAKSEADAAMDDLKNAYDKAVSYFK